MSDRALEEKLYPIVKKHLEALVRELAEHLRQEATEELTGRLGRLGVPTDLSAKKPRRGRTG